jgi:hypothetical protein
MLRINMSLTTKTIQDKTHHATNLSGARESVPLCIYVVTTRVALSGNVVPVVRLAYLNCSRARPWRCILLVYIIPTNLVRTLFPVSRASLF